MKANDGIWELLPYDDQYEQLESGDKIGYEIPYVIDPEEVIHLLLELMRKRVATGPRLYDYAVLVGHRRTSDTEVSIQDEELSREFEAMIDQLVTARELSIHGFKKFNGYLSFRPAVGDERIEDIALNLFEFI